jgi:hypothetical protein
MSYVDHVIYNATRDAWDWPHVTQWTWPTSELWEQRRIAERGGWGPSGITASWQLGGDPDRLQVADLGLTGP